MMDVVVNSSLVLDIGTCDLPLVDIWYSWQHEVNLYTYKIKGENFWNMQIPEFSDF
jgi:hypothetical protein